MSIPRTMLLALAVSAILAGPAFAMADGPGTDARGEQTDQPGDRDSGGLLDSIRDAFWGGWDLVTNNPHGDRGGYGDGCCGVGQDDPGKRDGAGDK